MTPPPSYVVEKHGRWYFPPLAALITAGGRLLLTMLERCVRDEGGTYLFCDTDSLCVVASEQGGLVACPGGTHRLPDGSEALKALSFAQVEGIAKKFRALNPYDPSVVDDILKVEKVNFDPAGKHRALYGYAISAKRYALYEYSGKKLTIVDPKAHGLGYLYPPVEKKGKDQPDWTSVAWEWLLREELKLPGKAPKWLDLPAMMRIVVSTPHVLDRLNHSTRPYNFLFCPLIDPVAGFPANVDPEHFRPMTAFTRKRERWEKLECVNAHDGKVYRLGLRQTAKLDRIIPQTFGYILRLYLRHPESKSLAPDGTPCVADTRGLLKRASVVACEMHYMGKETDRRWEQGEDVSLLEFTPMGFRPSEMMVADPVLREKAGKRGIRELMRKTELSQHTIEKILGGQPVRLRTVKRIVAAMKQ